MNDLFVFLNNPLLLIIVIIISIIFITNRLAKKRQREVEALVPQLKNQYKKESVFFCDFVDYIDGDSENIQMHGESNNIISQSTRVLDFSGVEHTIGDIYSVSRKESLPSVAAGEEVTISISSGDGWAISQFGNNRPIYSPEIQKLIQKIKDEKVVVLRLK
jgi:hypothetical protein